MEEGCFFNEPQLKAHILLKSELERIMTLNSKCKTMKLSEKKTSEKI